MTETEFRLIVNGAERSVACQPDTPLLDVLRHDLGLAGPKFGCGMGLCGACVVLIGARKVKYGQGHLDRAGADSRRGTAGRPGPGAGGCVVHQHQPG